MRIAPLRVAVVTAALAVGLLTPLSAASAAPADLPAPGVTSADGSSLVSVTPINDRQLTIEVRSAAMNRVVPLSVILPADRSVARPTLYLLNGAGGGEDAATWERQTDVVKFFSDKNAYVVTPNSGAYSYYTDWQRDDPVLGRNKWSTFLGIELPQVFDKAFATSGRNAIAGISSSGSAVLDLAIEHPGVFKAVGSYSGCAATSSPLGQAYVRLVVETRGGTTATNMWGPYTGQGWRDHDAVLNAAKLRGTSLYVSAGSGIPGKYENPAGVRPGNDLASQIILGGPIEAATDGCSQQLRDRLAALKIPATFHFPGTGTHSWGYWEDELHRSWPQLARAIGA
ncbi:alpha/beta hydrolase [Williamsia sp. MIQD14]|uniref:alpha/beta hydrolase n=1 Tax=Williamsia sp. MIQD14 TaxID=3425703 RepID=UPI003DA0478E